MSLRRTIRAAIVSFLLSGPVPGWTDPLVLAVGDWPPYFSQTMKEKGVFAHIVKDAFARKGIFVTYQFFPWARALFLAQEGVLVAASPGWVKTEERSQFFLFSDPVILSKEVLFFRKDRAIHFENLSDLAGHRIGAAIGYSYGAAFDAAEKAGQLLVERTQTDEQNLKKLLAGRLDAVALNRAVGYQLLSKFSLPERELLTVSEKSLSEKESRMAVSKNYPGAEELLSSFNAGLAELVKDGTVRRYLQAAENGEYEP